MGSADGRLLGPEIECAVGGADRGDDPVARFEVRAAPQLTLDERLPPLVLRPRRLVAARDAGVRRFILASSSAVYGDRAKPPLVETMPPAPISPITTGICPRPAIASSGPTRPQSPISGSVPRVIPPRYGLAAPAASGAVMCLRPPPPWTKLAA